MRRLALALCVPVLGYAAAALAAVPAGDETQVNVFTDGQQDDAQVTIDPDGGGFTVAWQSEEDGVDTPDDVLIRRFGDQPFGETRINFGTAGDEDDPTIASQDNGDGVVAFHTDDNAGQEDVKARLFRSGEPFGSDDITVAATSDLMKTAPRSRWIPTVTSSWLGTTERIPTGRK